MFRSFEETNQCGSLGEVVSTQTQTETHHTEDIADGDWEFQVVPIDEEKFEEELLVQSLGGLGLAERKHNYVAGNPNRTSGKNTVGTVV